MTFTKGHPQYNSGRTHFKKGASMPASQKTKISEALKGRMPKNIDMLRTPEVRKKVSDALKGAKSYLWRGGVTPENLRIRGSREYRLWRTAVFERDNYTCVWCGLRSAKGVKAILNADHIKSFADYPELRFAIDNGRTLCKACHATTDTYMGRGRKYK